MLRVRVWACNLGLQKNFIGPCPLLVLLHDVVYGQRATSSKYGLFFWWGFKHGPLLAMWHMIGISTPDSGPMLTRPWFGLPLYNP